jgi:hypothetical protein
LLLCDFSVLTTEKLCAIGIDGEADNRNIPAAKDKLIPGKSVEISLS